MSKVVLMILDGWGIGNRPSADAIASANTPFIDSCYENYPHSTLKASEDAVGLPIGQMGNSEVGHFTIGAGRVVFQELVRINQAIDSGELAQHATLKQALIDSQKNNKKFHLFGLVSNGGVHSHINHLLAICKIAYELGNNNIYVHLITDGRDTSPTSGISFVQEVLEAQKKYGFHIVDVIGRYYAMDRDNRWERVKLAYDLWVKGLGKDSNNLINSIQQSYLQGETDEFLQPIVDPTIDGRIQDSDFVLSFNFRTDRAREITQVLCQQDFYDFGMTKLDLNYMTMTNYDDRFKGVKVLFDKDDLSMTLGEVLEKNKKKQLRVAETEKYPHVTFFFSGGRERTFVGEERILIPSPKVATYDLQPEMSAHQIKEALINELKKEEVDFVCVNFANPDMVGHTGVFDAVVKAVETVDSCAKEIVEVGIKHNYSFLIIADHGNADQMLNEDGTVNTAHSLNLVPCILIDRRYKKINNGKLADVAPTILKLMDLDIPIQMTGKVLVQ